MRLLANTDQTSLRGKRDPLNGLHSTQGKLLLQNFEISHGIDLYSVLVSARVFKINSSTKKLRRKNKPHFVSRNLTTINRKNRNVKAKTHRLTISPPR
jgi:hypothetical protein